MELDEALDMAVMVMVTALFVLLLVPQMVKMSHADYGGFDTHIEKTALKTDKELPDLKQVFYKEDILLMVAVTDEYEPQPRVFDVDGLSVPVDANFLQNRIPPLVAVNTKLATATSGYTLSVTPGTTIATNWKFTPIP